MKKVSLPRWLIAFALFSSSVGLYAAHQLGRDDSLSGADTRLSRLGPEPTAMPVELLEEALERLEARLARYPDDHEASLLKGLILFKTGLREEALAELERLVGRVPRFHLAHLVRGDLLLAQAQVVQEIGSSPLLHAFASADKELASLKEEAEARLSAYLDSLPQGRIPRALLRLSAREPHALVVDKTAHRLYIYRRDPEGVPRLVQDFYVSTGRANGNKFSTGDLRTPEGVYFVTSHIPDNELPDKYGVGAFPLNYPNAWDRRVGKSGYGIWLHGTETDYYSRPPLDSEGCVVLPNIDLGAAAAYIAPGRTPVIITEEVEWLEERAWLTRQRELLAAVEHWRRDWESLDVEKYLSHYAGDFWSGRHDLRSWSERKRRVASGKTYQRVELEDISVFAYPQSAAEGREMAVVNFRQRYDSNNYTGEVAKHLYLVRQGSAWRILHEGAQ